MAKGAERGVANGLANGVAIYARVSTDDKGQTPTTSSCSCVQGASVWATQ